MISRRREAQGQVCRVLLKETSHVAILSREAWLVCRGLRVRRREEATSVHRELATGGEYSAVGGKGRSQMGRKNNRVGNIRQENPPKR